jgi:hypothetical protein
LTLVGTLIDDKSFDTSPSEHLAAVRLASASSTKPTLLGMFLLYLSIALANTGRMASIGKFAR